MACANSARPAAMAVLLANQLALRASKGRPIPHPEAHPAHSVFLEPTVILLANQLVLRALKGHTVILLANQLVPGAMLDATVLRVKQRVPYAHLDPTVLLLVMLFACLAQQVNIAPSTVQSAVFRAKRATSAPLVPLFKLLVLQAATARHRTSSQLRARKTLTALRKNIHLNRSAHPAPLGSNLALDP